MAYSDEPVLVTPKSRWSLKTIVAVLLVVGLVGGILSIPFYQKNLDAEAHDAPRGPHHGTLHSIVLEKKTPAQLELGWIAPAFSAVLTPAPEPGTTLEVSGEFGSETLPWNAAEKRFGPGSFKLNPYAHHKVKLTLRHGDRVLWRDTVWAYGIHDTHGHSH